MRLRVLYCVYPLSRANISTPNPFLFSGAAVDCDWPDCPSAPRQPSAAPPPAASVAELEALRSVALFDSLGLNNGCCSFADVERRRCHSPQRFCFSDCDLHSHICRFQAGCDCFTMLLQPYLQLPVFYFPRGSLAEEVIPLRGFTSRCCLTS
jgi:hypothetical protein